MAELNNEIDKKQCINCGLEIDDKCKIDRYPDEFLVYLCPDCGYENDWWITYNFGENIIRESMIHALFFESYYKNKDLKYDKAIEIVRQNIENSDLEDDIKNHIVENIEEYTRSRINDLFNEFTGNKFIIPKNVKIHAVRHPKKLHNEQYNRIQISQSQNSLADFFNNRVIRQWDLKYLDMDLNELRDEIKKDKEIRFKNRWLAAIDYFLNCA